MGLQIVGYDWVTGTANKNERKVNILPNQVMAREKQGIALKLLLHVEGKLQGAEYDYPLILCSWEAALYTHSNFYRLIFY